MTTKPSHIWRVGRGAVYSVLIAVIGMCSWGSVASGAENPQAVVQAGTNQVIRLLRAYPGNSQALRPKILLVVDNYFDFHAIARGALGPEWKQQSPAKQEQFTKAFSKLLFDTYISKIEQYNDQSISYVLLQQGADNAAVRAYVSGDQNLDSIPIDYYLHLNHGAWKVYDLVINGMGLVSNYRDQFNTILARSSFDDLLRRLEAKNAQG